MVIEFAEKWDRRDPTPSPFSSANDICKKALFPLHIFWDVGLHVSRHFFHLPEVVAQEKNFVRRTADGEKNPFDFAGKKA